MRESGTDFLLGVSCVHADKDRAVVGHEKAGDGGLPPTVAASWATVS